MERDFLDEIDEYDPDDYECRNDSLLIYDQQVVEAFPELFPEENKRTTTMHYSGATLKICPDGERTVPVAFEDKGGVMKTTVYRFPLEHLSTIDAYYTADKYTRIEMGYQINGIWENGWLYLGKESYWMDCHSLR